MSKSTRKTEEIAKQYYEIGDDGKIRPVRLLGQFVEDKPINKGFCKLWHNMRGRLETLPSIDIDLFLYLIYRSDSRNRGQIYMQSLAKMYKTTRQRVSRHINTLIDCNLLKMAKSGHYMMNPDYIFKGQAEERQSLVEYYQKFVYEWK